MPNLPATPISAAEGSKQYRRTYLTDKNKITLVRLCVDNQKEFAKSSRGAFWAMISQLLLQKAGVDLKDPSGRLLQNNKCSARLIIA